MTVTAAAYFELSKQEKEKADRCQVHKPHHASLLGYAQLYAMWAIYAQGSLRAPVTE